MSREISNIVARIISGRKITASSVDHTIGSRIINGQKNNIVDVFDEIGTTSYKGILREFINQMPETLVEGDEFPILGTKQFTEISSVLRTHPETDAAVKAAVYVAGLLQGYYGAYSEDFLKKAMEKKRISKIFSKPDSPNVKLSSRAPRKILQLKPGGLAEGTAGPKIGQGRTKSVFVETRKPHLNKPEDGPVIEDRSPERSLSREQMVIVEKSIEERKEKIAADIGAEVTEMLNGRIASEIDRIKQETAALAKEFDETQAKYAEELQAKAIAVQNDAETKIKKLAKEADNRANEAIENALEGTKAEGILRQAFTLWEEKENSHRRNFYIGIVAFTGLIALSALALSWNWETVKSAVGEAANAAVAKDSVTIATAQLLSRIVLLSLPFAVVLWILRAILRWANLNLSLAEDAAQRSVLAQTYVNLLAHGHIEQDKDREIMLSALFRPLPGVKDIDIPPMSIREYVDPTAKPVKAK